MPAKRIVETNVFNETSIMNFKSFKSAVRVSAVVASAAMAMSLSGVVHAASGDVAVNPPTQVMIDMQQFDQRISQLPQLANVKAGNVVTLADDGSITGATWQGNYVYRPAGTVINAGSSFYARWKDGVVTLTPTPAKLSGQAAPGTLDASYVENNADGSSNQTIRTLVVDSSDTTVLRIPDNAWLVRMNAQGQYVALVDMFEFQGGNQPTTLQQQAELMNGTVDTTFTVNQPVPVVAGQ